MKRIEQVKQMIEQVEQQVKHIKLVTIKEPFKAIQFNGTKAGLDRLVEFVDAYGNGYFEIEQLTTDKADKTKTHKARLINRPDNTVLINRTDIKKGY